MEYEPPPPQVRRLRTWNVDDSRLDQTTDVLLAKFGQHTDILINCVLTKAAPFHRMLRFTKHIATEQIQKTRALFWRPMLSLLQVMTQQEDDCCAVLSRLRVCSGVLSGSQMEGFGDTEVTVRLESDHDTMLDFGPVRWIQPAAQSRTAGHCAVEPAVLASHLANLELADHNTRYLPGQPSGLSESVPPQCSNSTEFGSQMASLRNSPPPRKDGAGSSEPPLLRLVPTANPGFVQVLKVKTPCCGHPEEQVFSAVELRRLMERYARVGLQGASLAASGPAVTLTMDHPVIVSGIFDNDLVPCLRAPFWPSREFEERPRRRDWPPEAVRRDIVRFGMHLVPTGCKGSATEESEWRLSFSRAEVAAAWYLEEVQRCTLLVLKTCKKQLGPLPKVLKSYFMKTALYWLCQDTELSQWKGVVCGAHMVLNFLESAAATGRLECFFWREINLLARFSPEELAQMRKTVRQMRELLPRLAVRACADLHMRTVRLLLERQTGAAPLREGQLRSCLARALIIEGVNSALSMMLTSSTQRYVLDSIPELLRCGAAAELFQMQRLLLMVTGLQMMLFRALLVAPDHVAAQMRLTALGDGTFAWDAAPLMALLTGSDVHLLLERPEQVLTWCERQRAAPPEFRPAGLPDNPRTAHGLAQLILNTPLLVQAIGEALPGWREMFHRKEQEIGAEYWRCPKPRAPSLALAREEAGLQMRRDLSGNLAEVLEVEAPVAAALADGWRQEMARHWQQSATADELAGIRRSVLDAWQLRPLAAGLRIPSRFDGTPPVPTASDAVAV